MTQPNIVPVGYTNDYHDYLKCKVDRSGAERAIFNSVSVPTGTTTGNLVGLAPFNKGARLAGAYVYSAALGTSVTGDIGYVYSDNVNNTNKVNAFVAASTSTAAGGIITTNTPDVVTWIATGDGWFVLNTGGATTGSTGTVNARISVAYDIGGQSQ